jgi:hypothetical protein
MCFEIIAASSEKQVFFIVPLAQIRFASQKQRRR